MGSKPRCETCRFWKVSDHSDRIGKCGAHPPDADSRADWPRTESHDWCGEHEPREEPEDDGAITCVECGHDLAQDDHPWCSACVGEVAARLPPSSSPTVRIMSPALVNGSCSCADGAVPCPLHGVNTAPAVSPDDDAETVRRALNQSAPDAVAPFVRMLQTLLNERETLTRQLAVECEAKHAERQAREQTERAAGWAYRAVGVLATEVGPKRLAELMAADVEKRVETPEELVDRIEGMVQP